MPPTIHHLALRVADLERAADFYGGLLGLAEVRRQGGEGGRLRAIWFELGAAVLMLELDLRGAGAAAGSAHVLALGVDALAPWERRLAAAGVAIDDRTEFTLFVRDPDGHRVGLSALDPARLRA
ncbi:MAG: VOC family protein [Myxococcales bacterium]|nr:VOC family protein [Myxococcales bacterium]